MTEDYSEYDGMTDEELFPEGFPDLPKEERRRRVDVMTMREHERFMAEWATLSDEERKRRRMVHFMDCQD